MHAPLDRGDREGAVLQRIVEAVLDLPTARNGNVRRTSLSAFGRGNVIVRFRASYPAAEAATRTDQVENLIRAVLQP